MVDLELSVVAERASVCTACRLADSRTQVVFGSGDPAADVMIIGEAPGREEDRAGLPFVGRSGQLLDRLIADELGLGRGQCYVANVVKCRPPENRNPLPDEVEACRGYLSHQLAFVQPRVVVTLGNFAMRALLDTTAGITSMRGVTYPFNNASLIPTFHPAAALRGGASILALMRADFGLARALLDQVRS